jgi:hypothetical protein
VLYPSKLGKLFRCGLYGHDEKARQPRSVTPL